MALVACKECGQQISSSANACPACGKKINRTSATTWVVAGLIGVGAIIGISQQASTPPPTPQQTAQKAKDDAAFQHAELGALTLKKAMRNPDSFKLSSAITMGSGSTCYEYRAQNGFGGMNVGHAVFSGDGKKFKSEDSPGFSSLWNKECSKSKGIEYADEINAVL